MTRDRRRTKVLLAAIVAAVVPAAAGPAWASGEADATIVSRYYRLRVSSGVRVMPAPEADDGPAEAPAKGELPPCERLGYFEREEREFLARVGPYLPHINRRVEAAVRRLGLAPFDVVHPDLPGAVTGEKVTGDDVYRRDDDVAAAKAWLDGSPGRAGLVIGRAKIRAVGGEGALPLSLEVAVTRPIARKALDALAAEVARAIGKTPVPSPTSVLSASCTGMAPPPWPAGLTPAKPVIVTEPGLRVRVGKAASAIDSAHVKAWDERMNAYARRAAKAFADELRTQAATLGLPPDWPATSAGELTAEESDKPPTGGGKPAPAFYVTYAGMVPEIAIKAPLRKAPGQAAETAAFKKLYYLVGPPDPTAR